MAASFEDFPERNASRKHTTHCATRRIDTRQACEVQTRWRIVKRHFGSRACTVYTEVALWVRETHIVAIINTTVFCSLAALYRTTRAEALLCCFFELGDTVSPGPSARLLAQEPCC